MFPFYLPGFAYLVKNKSVIFEGEPEEAKSTAVYSTFLCVISLNGLRYAGYGGYHAEDIIRRQGVKP
jgi:hypothetical protein